MDRRLSLYAVGSGLIAAVLLLPLLLAWLPAQLSAAWPWALDPLMAWTPVAFAPLALIWGASKGAGPAVDRGAGRARGALAGLIGGATLSLFVIGPAAGLWSLQPVAPLIGTAQDGLALGRVVADATATALSGAALLWLLCLGVGVGAGLMGGTLVPVRRDGAHAPSLLSLRAAGLALALAVSAATILPPMAAALGTLYRSMADLNQALLAEGLSPSASPQGSLLLFWLCWGALLLPGALGLHGALARLRGWPGRRLRDELWALFAPAMAVGAPALCLAIEPELAVQPGAAALALLTVLALLAASRAQPAHAEQESGDLSGWLVGGLALAGSLPALTIAAGLAAGLGIVPLIGALVSGAPPSGGLDALVADLLWRSLGLPVAGMALAAALLAALGWLSRRRVAAAG